MFTAPRPSFSGETAWLGLIAYVFAYDIIALRSGRSTLSAAFYNGVQKKHSAFLLILAWGALTGHLFHLIPRKYDVFHILD